MTFTAVRHDGVVVLKMDGAILGGPEATALNQELHRLIDDGITRVVIDLGSVTLMNSSGLGMLIGGYTTLKNAGGEFRLAAANENIRTLISITKLNTIFQSFATVEDALAGF